MSHGRLNAQQRTALQPYVQGKCIYDLGAGDLALAHQLASMDAEHVIAVDKEYPYWVRSRSSRVEKRQCRYEQVLGESVSTLFISWPANWVDVPLLVLTVSAETIIYLGNNLDGTACGFKEFFEHLLFRELLVHEPDHLNTLLVCGKYRTPAREPTWEERAAIHQETILKFADYPRI